jgi:hypothetical protein
MLVKPNIFNGKAPSLVLVRNRDAEKAVEESLSEELYATTR